MVMILVFVKKTYLYRQNPIFWPTWELFPHCAGNLVGIRGSKRLLLGEKTGGWKKCNKNMFMWSST